MDAILYDLKKDHGTDGASGSGPKAILVGKFTSAYLYDLDESKFTVESHVKRHKPGPLAGNMLWVKRQFDWDLFAPLLRREQIFSTMKYALAERDAVIAKSNWFEMNYSEIQRKARTEPENAEAQKTLADAEAAMVDQNAARERVGKFQEILETTKGKLYARLSRGFASFAKIEDLSGHKTPSLHIGFNNIRGGATEEAWMASKTSDFYVKWGGDRRQPAVERLGVLQGLGQVLVIAVKLDHVGWVGFCLDPENDRKLLEFPVSEAQLRADISKPIEIATHHHEWVDENA